MTIVDGDVVDITNINRQLPALHSTVGQPKSPSWRIDWWILIRIKIDTRTEFLSQNDFEIVGEEFDYVFCIDSITPKLNLIIAAKEKE
jgi:tRNA A37 threonylcarbamoyladenosine dehydratase